MRLIAIESDDQLDNKHHDHTPTHTASAVTVNWLVCYLSLHICLFIESKRRCMSNKNLPISISKSIQSLWFYHYLQQLDQSVFYSIALAFQIHCSGRGTLVLSQCGFCCVCMYDDVAY